MHTLIAFLGNYSSQFWFSVVAGLFVSALFTVPIAALLYHRRGQLRLLTVLGIYLSILYAFALIFFTLFPVPEDPRAFCATHHLRPNLDPLQFVADFQKQPRSVVLQTGFNVVFFIPLGFSLRRVFRWRSWAVVLDGFATSLFIECSQLTGIFGIFPCAYRLFDVDDLITNTLGAVVGLLIAQLVNRISPPKPANHTVVTQPGLIRRSVAFLVDAIFVSATACILLIITSMIVSAFSGGTVGMAQITGSDRLRSPLGIVFLLLALAFFQWWIPWRSGGRTLAGRYVHMSIETKPRTGKRRLLFYAVRYAVIAGLFLGDWWSLLLALALLVFFLVKKQMPYDLLPSDEPSQPDRPSQSDLRSQSASSRNARNRNVIGGNGNHDASHGSSAVSVSDVPRNRHPSPNQTQATVASTHNQDFPADPAV